MLTKSKWIVQFVLTLLIMTGLLCPAQPVRAAQTWQVNTDSDTGSCADKVCSLRGAIAVANSGDTITFAGDYTIVLGSQLEINKNLIIDGSGHAITISGDGSVRVFQIKGESSSKPITVTLSHLSIAKGKVLNNDIGGGIKSIYSNLTVISSTISDSTAYYGGGIGSSDSTLVVQNSTISGNTSSNGGAGIYSFGLTTIENSTIANNTGGFSGGIQVQGSSGTPGFGLKLSNTLIADNDPGDCVIMNAPVLTNDHNLMESSYSTYNCNLTNGENGTIIGVDPLLSELGSYDGHHQTMALLPGSPALNAGNSSTCLANDQRGVSRVGACDIGAFESRGFKFQGPGGSGQKVEVSGVFASPLSVQVISPSGEPVNGGQVIFTGPETGAGLTSNSYTTTISDGVASQQVTANDISGAYTIRANMSGNLEGAIEYTLTNIFSGLGLVGNEIKINSGDDLPSVEDQTDFGSHHLGETQIHTFSIDNNASTGKLIIDGVTLDGAAAGDFDILGLSTPATISAGESVTFQVRFRPTTLGERSATVRISSNDYKYQDPPYYFAIRGLGQTGYVYLPLLTR